MANSKITWNDKVSLVTDPTIAEINKVTDSNMNEIKNVVNTNADQVILSDTEPTSNDNELWIDTAGTIPYINSEIAIGSSNDSNIPVWFKQGKNLIDTNKIINGLYSISNGNYSYSNAECCTSQMLEVDNTKNYTLSTSSSDTSKVMYVFFYDSSKSFLGYVSTQFNGLIRLSDYENYSSTKYINLRFSVAKNNLPNIQLEVGDTATTYEAYVNKEIIADELKYLEDINEPIVIDISGNKTSNISAITRAYVTKVGKVCYLNLASNIGSSPNSNNPLFSDVPFLPRFTTELNYMIGDNNTNWRCLINTSGQISSGHLEANKFCTINGVYITD